MGLNKLLSNEEYFRIMLQPALRVNGYRSMVVEYRISGVAGQVLGDEFLITKGLRINPKFPLGFEPYAIRRADNDDAARIAKFLWLVATGRLHPSMYQYLLSTVTQIEIKTGQRPPITKAPGAGPVEKPKTAADRFGAEFDKNVKIDDDYKRIAKKVEADRPHAVEKILAERPHLLEDNK